MPILKSDLPAMHQGASALAQLILGNKNKMAEQQNQADVDVGKAKQMLPIEQQGMQNKSDIDVAKEGQLQDQNVDRALSLKDMLDKKTPGHKFNVNMGAGGGVAFGETESNPLPMMMAHDKQVQQGAQGYSKRLENVNGFNAALQEIEAKTNRDGQGGILTNPNAKALSVGGLKSSIPEGATGLAEMIGVLPKGATDERKGFQRLANEYMKATSGMRVTPEAAAREKAAMGMVMSNDPDLASKGARALAMMMKQRIAAIQGGYPEEVRNQVHSMSGNPADAYANIYDDNAQPGQQAPAPSAPAGDAQADARRKRIAELKAKLGK